MSTKKPQKPDTSPKIHQRSKIDYDLDIRVAHTLNQKQQEILDCMVDKQTKCVFVDGLWGTSKTYLSVLAGLKLLNDKKVDEIIYVRNPVESSTTGKTGTLPGTAAEKMAPWAAVQSAKLEEFLSKSTIEKLDKELRVSFMPLGYIRGLNWTNKVVICDEASSLTFEDLKLLLTRCGERTKIYVVGDSLNQSDIGNKSGFDKMFKIFSDQDSKDNGVFTFEMKSSEDIVRSGFVRYVMTKIGSLKTQETAPKKEKQEIIHTAEEWSPAK